MNAENKDKVLDTTTVSGFVEWRRRKRIRITIARNQLSKLVNAMSKVDDDSTKVGAQLNPNNDCVDRDINKLG